MRTSYKGHEIDVHREECLGGWTMLYFTIVRESDGYFCVDSFEDSDENVADKIKQLKARVDAELQEGDPWEERARELGMIDRRRNAEAVESIGRVLEQEREYLMPIEVAILRLAKDICAERTHRTEE